MYCLIGEKFEYGPIEKGKLYSEGVVNEELPILREDYTEVAAFYQVYWAQLELEERQKKWQKVHTNTSTISELPPTF